MKPCSSTDVAALLALIGVHAAAVAQEPINAADSATQPSPGHVIFKEQFRFYSLELDHGRRDRRGEIDDSMLYSTLNVGLQSDISLSFRVPIVFRDRELDLFDREQSEQGVADVTALAKWRFLQLDTGALTRHAPALSLVRRFEAATHPSRPTRTTP